MKGWETPAMNTSRSLATLPLTPDTAGPRGFAGTKAPARSLRRALAGGLARVVIRLEFLSSAGSVGARAGARRRVGGLLGLGRGSPLVA